MITTLMHLTETTTVQFIGQTVGSLFLTWMFHHTTSQPALNAAYMEE